MNVFLFITTFVLVVDFIWLTLMKPHYNSLVRGVQRRPLVVNMYGAVFSYVCVLGSIFLFALPAVKTAIKSKKYSPLAASFIFGGMLGFFIYGVFNFTNIAIFSNYDMNMAAIDTLWGTVLYTITCLAAVKIAS